LINLISNAIKYSPNADKVVVTSSSDEEKITVSVQDFGIGIAPELQEKVFERFFRVYDEKIKSFPGLGLGLYIAAEIIKRHGGNFSVKSQKNKGSVFVFTVPIKFSPPPSF
jgi:signal transduction histidine kinase